MMDSLISFITSSTKDKKFRIAAYEISANEQLKVFLDFFQFTHPNIILNSIDIINKNINSSVYRDHLFFMQGIERSSQIDERVSPLMPSLDFDKSIEAFESIDVHLIQHIYSYGVIVDFLNNKDPYGKEIDLTLPDTFQDFIALLEARYKITIDINSIETLRIDLLQDLWGFIKKHLKQILFSDKGFHKNFLDSDEIKFVNEELYTEFENYIKTNHFKEYNELHLLFLKMGLEKIFMEVYRQKMCIPNKKQIDEVQGIKEELISHFPNFSEDDASEFMTIVASSKWSRDRKGKCYDYLYDYYL